MASQPAEFPTHYGRRLRVLLEDHGMTQSEMAMRIGVTPQRIAQYLRSKKFHPTTVERLCAAMEITPDEFRRTV